MDNFQKIGGLISVIIGIITVIQWGGNSVLFSLISVIFFLIGGLSLNVFSFEKRYKSDKSSKESIEKFSKSYNTITENIKIIESINVENQSIQKHLDYNILFSEIQKISNLELGGTSGIEVKDPQYFSHKLANLLLKLASKTSISKYLYTKVYIRWLAGFTISLKKNIIQTPTKYVMVACIMYLCFAIIFMQFHLSILKSQNYLPFIIFSTNLLNVNASKLLAQPLSSFIFKNFGVFYIINAIIYQFYSLVPMLYKKDYWVTYEIKDADSEDYGTQYKLKFSITYLFLLIYWNSINFMSSIIIFIISIIMGILSEKANIGFEVGFVFLWGIFAYIGFRRLVYSISMLLIGSYIILLVGAVMKSCS